MNQISVLSLNSPESLSELCNSRQDFSMLGSNSRSTSIKKWQHAQLQDSPFILILNHFLRRILATILFPQFHVTTNPYLLGRSTLCTQQWLACEDAN